MACLARWTQPAVDGAVHLVDDCGTVHRLDDGVGGFDAAAQGLVEVDVLARLGALDSDDAPPLDAGAHADDLDVGPRERLVEVADVRDAVVVGQLLIELHGAFRGASDLVGNGNEAAAGVLGEYRGMALLVGALAAYEQDAELGHGRYSSRLVVQDAAAAEEHQVDARARCLRRG